MKIALVHDWLTNMGGAEKVLLEFSRMFPEAPIFTAVYNPKKTLPFAHKTIIPSFIQKIPSSQKYFQYFLPLMPIAVESFDLSNFDIVISSSWSVAKGIISKPNTIHICYCHTPTRYAWASSVDERLQKGSFSRIRQFYATWFRAWDIAAASRVDVFLANSKYTAQRIKKFYQRSAIVVYPPIDTEYFTPNSKTQRENFYLFVSRLIPYKRADLAILACNQLKKKLKIVSIGPELKKLKKIAGPNVEFLGQITDEKLRNLYQSAKALIFPAEEDFGIVPVEAASCGCPVIAYSQGGQAETIVDKKTGILFNKQNSTSLIQAIEQLEKTRFSDKTISRHAHEFSRKVFQQKIKKIIKAARLPCLDRKDYCGHF